MKLQQVAEQTGLSIHTLRYYEQMGLISRVARQANGHRNYTDDDVYRIRFVMRLRDADMPIADIRRYVELAESGDETIAERLVLLEAHQHAIQQRIQDLQLHLNAISSKIEHYRESNQLRGRGSTDSVGQNSR